MTPILKILVGTHFFQVTPLRGEDKASKVCFDFARNFLKVDIQGRQRTITTFAAANSSRSWFRFHFNALSDFLDLLSARGIPKEQYTLEYLPEPTPQVVPIPIRDGWKAKDYQEPIIEYLTEKVGAYDIKGRQWVDGKSRSRLVGIQTGKGKLIKDGTLVKVPLGWRTIESLTLNDKVMAVDGSYVDVLGVFPEKDVQMYKVVTEDGRSLEVHKEHLWSFHLTTDQGSDDFRVGTTEQIATALKTTGSRVYIPLCNSATEPVELTVHLDPYILGAYIARGNYTSTELLATCPEEIKHNVEYLRTRSPAFTVKIALQALDILNVAPERVFVPFGYKKGSTSQRSALLQGILDSKGIVHESDNGSASKVSFTTISEQLATDVQYLAHSIGAICSVNQITTDGVVSYFVLIQHKNPDELFRFTKHELTHDPDLKLRIVDVVQTTRSNATCIAVDHHDKTFVCQGYIVTHNTFCALKSISDLGLKFVVIVLARFVDKWAGGYGEELRDPTNPKGKKVKKYFPGDIEKILDLKKEEILKIQTGRDMKMLTAMDANDMKPYKGVVISNRIFDSYTRAFEFAGDDLPALGYETKPDDLWTKLGIGLRLIDEVHMQYHANFRVDLYTHIKRSISLSATLLSRDPAMTRVYKTGYPPAERFLEGEIDKYIDSFGVIYRVDDRWNYKTTNRGSSNYSHTAYEDSILKNKAFLGEYFEMVKKTLDNGYIKYKRPGNKAIVFCATVEMCGLLSEYLQKAYPELSVKRYVSADPYEENYQRPDIRVTTIGSGGTGHDVPGLTDNIITVAVDSIQAVIQAFGRLRKIEDQATRCYFFTCEDIEKHVGYHKKKIDVMRERAKSFTQMFYGVLGERDYNFH